MPHPFQIFSQSDYLIQIVDKNSHSDWQTVQIQISWLLQKPTDLDLHCLQKQDYPGSAGQGLNENIVFLLTISYQKPFVFSVSVFCSQICTLKLNLWQKIGLTYVHPLVK